MSSEPPEITVKPDGSVFVVFPHKVLVGADRKHFDVNGNVTSPGPSVHTIVEMVETTPRPGYRHGYFKVELCELGLVIILPAGRDDHNGDDPSWARAHAVGELDGWASSGRLLELFRAFTKRGLLLGAG